MRQPTLLCALLAITALPQTLTADEDMARASDAVTPNSTTSNEFTSNEFTSNESTPDPFTPADIQVFVGALELDDQSGAWSDISDGPVDINFPTMPVFGIEAEYVVEQGWLHLGINPGGSIAWKNDNTQFSGTVGGGGGSLAVQVDNSMFLLEGHLGGFVRGRLHARITAYAAAGPMLLYASHDVEGQNITQTDEDELPLTEDSGTGFGLGYYARAGVDFQIQPKRHLGLGFRYSSAEIDFDDTIGNIDIEGPQWVLTFTQGL